ncbi:MAG: phenylacetate--CoA ligase [Gammaproteobacteria bacterium]|nr:phenylacetate--CoA ligase [Gammaproteobacteria bacterium]MDH3468293.1 phenylacetate--CoA ligase [Gammaproteobacteria bacterium]
MNSKQEGGLHPIETASRDELTALQLQRLKWSVKHAYDNVARYREKFDEAGVHPADIQDLSDLAKFPFTTKQDLRENYPFAMFAVPEEDVVRVHVSSGTTGKPTVVGYSKNDIDMWSDVMARSIYASGGRPGDKVHISYGYGLFTGGLGAHYGAERLGCMVIPMSGGQTERQIQLIADFRPDVIMVTPTYCLNIIDGLERQGMAGDGCSLRIGLFGAEPWGTEMRREIEERMCIDAMDLYGLSEIIGPGVASECIETKDGPTVWEDHFYPEIINPDTGEMLKDGEHGELVFTSLTKEAFPVIRYRTCDLSRLLPGTARTMRRFDKITGRTDDMMIIRGVNIFPSQIEELILKQEDLAPHYQLELSRSGNLDALAVNVEIKPGVSTQASDRVAAELQHNIKAFIGVSTKINILGEGEIPRSQGKAQRVVDNRPKG